MNDSSSATCKIHFLPECANRLRCAFACFRISECIEKALAVLLRAEQMCGFIFTCFCVFHCLTLIPSYFFADSNDLCGSVILAGSRISLI